MSAAHTHTPSEAGPESLLGIDGAHHSISSLAGRTATVIVFIGNGCPTVRAYEDRLMALKNNWEASGVNLIAINANNHFLSSPDTIGEMAKRATERRFNFAYLKDEDRVVAKHLGAICTPHAFVLDRNLEVAYSGRIDDSRVGDTITSRNLENAVADVVAGRVVTVTHTEPFGCSIVW